MQRAILGVSFDAVKDNRTFADNADFRSRSVRYGPCPGQSLWGWERRFGEPHHLYHC